MKLSTRARYGTRALLELALRQGEGPVLLKEIASKQQISLPYLEGILVISNGTCGALFGPFLVGT